MVPLGRAGQPEEIAEAIVYVTSTGAGFLTGQTIFLDGGMSAAQSACYMGCIAPFGEEQRCQNSN